MDFVSYTVKFLNQRLNLYESKNSTDLIHEAKVFLKFLEDIKDEGYKESYDHINAQTKAVSRLRLFIQKNNSQPFEMEKFSVDNKLNYKKDNYEIDVYLSYLQNQMKSNKNKLNSIPDVFYDILGYSQDIFNSAKEGTAYCFLLRDVMLPFFAFKNWDQERKYSSYPLFISRKFLSFFDVKEANFDVYNEIQNIIFTALDEGINDFNKMRIYIKENIKSKKEFDKLVDSIKVILSKIKDEKIMIIESGYIGTIPILLSALDDRVDFRLFTTIPFFYEVYKGKYYTNEFQKIRSFETIQCQDALFKLSSIENDKIKVCEVLNHNIKERAFAELHTWNDLIVKYRN